MDEIIGYDENSKDINIENGQPDINTDRSSPLEVHKKSLSWHIPRPSLISSHSNSLDSDYVLDQRDGSITGSHFSQKSTQSAKSGSLLLSFVNVAMANNEQQKISGDKEQHLINLQCYLDEQHKKLVNGEFGYTNTSGPHSLDILGSMAKTTETEDSISVASSTHFTVVNGLDRHRNKIAQSSSCCHKHRLTALVITMSSLFMFGIIVAVYLFEMRATHIRSHS